MLKRVKNLLSRSIDTSKSLSLWTYDFNPLYVIFNIIRSSGIIIKNFKYWCYGKLLILNTYRFSPLPLPFNINMYYAIIIIFFYKRNWFTSRRMLYCFLLI